MLCSDERTEDPFSFDYEGALAAKYERRRLGPSAVDWRERLHRVDSGLSR